MSRPKNSIHQTIYNDLFEATLSKADQKKFLILEAAIQTYAELGIEYVSYEDIARRAKVTRPLVNHYFPSKKVLFETAMKLVRAQFQEMVVGEIKNLNSPTEQLSAYIRAAVSWYTVSPTQAKAWLFFFYICVSDPTLRREHKKLTEMGMERLEGLLKNVAVEKGHEGNNLGQKAKAIQRVITGALIEIATEYGQKEKQAYAEIAQQTVATSFIICGYNAPGE